MARKYPIYMAPRQQFQERLAKEQDPAWEITGLEFIQWAKKRFSARWRWRQQNQKFAVDMSLGGAEPSLDSIEERVIKALKPNGTT